MKSFERKFIKYANSVGFNLNNSTPIETIAFQTVACVELNPRKGILNHNDLTTCDSIIFALFIIRMLCIGQIKPRRHAERFSDEYISKVFQYFPKYKQISNKYDHNFFEERVRYYDAVFNVNANSFDEGIERVVKTFESIIMYDYEGEYTRFNENTPLMILDFQKHFEISMAVKIFYNSLPELFGKLLIDVKSYYDDLPDPNVFISYKDGEQKQELLTKEEAENMQFFYEHVLPILIFVAIFIIMTIIASIGN